eukprot:1195967-Prorocentrum_minimum.AAC.3
MRAANVQPTIERLVSEFNAQQGKCRRQTGTDDEPLMNELENLLTDISSKVADYKIRKQNKSEQTAAARAKLDGDREAGLAHRLNAMGTFDRGGMNKGASKAPAPATADAEEAEAEDIDFDFEEYVTPFENMYRQQHGVYPPGFEEEARQRHDEAIGLKTRANAIAGADSGKRKREPKDAKLMAIMEEGVRYQREQGQARAEMAKEQMKLTRLQASASTMMAEAAKEKQANKAKELSLEERRLKLQEKEFFFKYGEQLHAE